MNEIKLSSGQLIRSHLSKPDDFETRLADVNYIEPDIVELPTALISAPNAVGGRNWSGAFATPPTGEQVGIVFGDLVVPNAQSTIRLFPQVLTMWIGLDGMVDQATPFYLGVVAHAQNLFGSTYNCIPFLQWGSFSSVGIVSAVPVRAGDYLRLEIHNLKDPNDPNRIYAVITNVTANNAGYALDIQGAQPPVGGSADWMVGSATATVSGIPRYGIVSFSSASSYSADSAGALIEPDPGNILTMYDSQGKPISVGQYANGVVECTYTGP
ncbi:G1 family glutamic endopeptidase [Streptomyces collinus]|uniref:G1 family glutamic endopeptidase n=1 Tax=Streptomyces collinus TaxID=42684 RepID=UPI003693D7B8